MDRDIDVLDDPELEQDQEGVGDQEDQQEQHEPEVQEEHQPHLSRKEQIEAEIEQAAAGALEESVIDELAEKPDLTIEDLRRLPGADKLTDEQIEAQWKAAQATAGGDKGNAGAAETKTGEEAQDQTVKLPFPVYDAQGNKIPADKVTVQGLLDGSLLIGYSALDKEQRKALTDVIRTASNGHWNEKKFQTAVDERNRAAAAQTQLEAKVREFEAAQKTWDAALTAFSLGNPEPMKALIGAFQKAIQAQPAAAPGMIPIEQAKAAAEQERLGYQVHTEYIVPKAMEIAQRYGAKFEEVLGAVRWYVEHEPPQFFSREKLDAILQHEVPQLFESHGYVAKNDAGAKGAEGTGGAGEVEELRKQVAALQASIAERKNAQVQQVRDRQKKAPPAGSGATPGAGDGMPSFKNRAQMKAWLQNDPEWSKL